MSCRSKSFLGVVSVVLCLFAAATLATPSVADTEGEEIDALRRQVEDLTDALVLARGEIDALKAQAARSEFAQYPPLTLKPANVEPELHDGLLVLDANRELQMVVLNKGSRDGMRAGIPLGVVRLDKVVARVRVVDVRSRISGAVVLARDGGDFPEAGDTLIPVRDAVE